MVIYSSIDPFGSAMLVLGQTRRPNTVNKLVVIALQHVLTPLLVIVDMFAIFVPYLISV